MKSLVKPNLLFKWLVVISLFFAVSPSYAYHHTQVLSLPALIQKANTLPNIAVIKQTNQEYVYGAVSQQYINVLFPILYQSLTKKEQRCLKPDDQELGAHISLFYPDDMHRFIKAAINLKQFKFKPYAIKKVSIYHHDYLEIWYVLSVHAPKIMQTYWSIGPLDRYLKELHISLGYAKINYHDHTCYQ